jgi:hypothetical protein
MKKDRFLLACKQGGHLGHDANKNRAQRPRTPQVWAWPPLDVAQAEP